MKRIRQWCVAFLTLDHLAWRMDNHGKTIRWLLEREAQRGKLTRAEIERYVDSL